MLGKNDLSNFNETGTKNCSVKEIILHPEWQWDDNLNSLLDANIAIVVLEENVEFTSKIQPVCLPQQSSAKVVGDGTIAVWGQSDQHERHATTPKEQKILIMNALHCLTRFTKLAIQTTSTSFCGFFKNIGKGVCLGGFYSHDSPSSTWIVRGITSGSLIDNNGQCDVNAYQLYSNVAQFADWIGKVMKETKNDALEFECTRKDV
jgi:secreted trypsin-like serine protease